MRRILVLLAIIGVLFLLLPPTPAFAWSSVPFLLLTALFVDAYRAGRRQLLKREGEDQGEAGTDTAVQASRLFAGVMLLDAIWLGLSSNAPAMADIAALHGLDAGADFGGLDASGLDMGGHIMTGFDAGGDMGGMGGGGGGF